MSQLLISLENRKNILLEAFDSSQNIVSQSTDELVNIYQELFTSNVLHIKEQTPSFQKVSIIDPAIKTVLQSTTMV